MAKHQVPKKYWACSKAGCSNKQSVTIRIETKDGKADKPVILPFCRKHIRTAIAVLRQIAKIK